MSERKFKCLVLSTAARDKKEISDWMASVTGGKLLGAIVVVRPNASNDQWEAGLPYLAVDQARAATCVPPFRGP
ncbi:hypothetical protein [Pseudarthrobacter siccitolerans]